MHRSRRPGVRGAVAALVGVLFLSGCIADSGADAGGDTDAGTGGGAGGQSTGGGAGGDSAGGETPDARPVSGDAAVPPADAAGPAPDAGGVPDAAARPDQDDDGAPDAVDNCPNVPNARQNDADADGLGDACDVGDTDGDGTPDREDTCPTVTGPTPDTDADGIGDACDVCPDTADAAQSDEDGDGVGDLCEIPNDDDADGVPDARDNCPARPNGDQADTDQDGVGDLCDRCPRDADPDQLDTDADGLGDGCDACPEVAVVAENHLDRDGDGYPTCAEDCDDTDPNRYPGGAELCDGRDNDCDPSIDEAFPDLGEPCEVGLGACVRAGVRGCAGGDGGTACLAEPGAPVPEVCNDVDDDCDGSIDEGLVGCCDPGETSPCGADVGVCRPGVRTCDANRQWGACDGIEPAPETCDGQDEDCDGLTDDGFDLTRDPRNCGFCGNTCPGGGCEGGECFDARDVVMLCGSSSRSIETFTRLIDGAVAAQGCEPDATTLAMLVTRNGVEPPDGGWADYVTGGGNILTEYSVSDEVFFAVTGIRVPQGDQLGACQDNVMPEVQLSPDDPIWDTVPFAATPQGASGCGLDLSRFPDVVPLGRWAPSVGSVSLAYRDVGAGRLWLVESNWQDGNPALTAQSKELMAAMISWPRRPFTPECDDGLDNDADGRVDFPADPGCAAVGGRWECNDNPESCQGVPLDPAQGYGHHGNCDSWNACNDAQGCADMACRHAGYADAVHWVEAACGAEGIICNLFIDGGAGLDENYHGCNLPVVTQVTCR